MNTFQTIVASTLLATVTVAGCSSDSKSSSTTAPSTAASTAPGAVLTISDFQFSELTVAAGQEITINNTDGATHTVSADDKSFAVEVPGNGSATLTIPTPGTYAFHCDIHVSMKATITVS